MGPGRAQRWSDLSRRLGGHYKKGGIFKSGRVTLPHRNWQITIDEFTVHVAPILLMFIRLRAPYVNRDGSRFRIYKKSAFSVIGKWLGVQDIEVGDPHFDQEFIIQGRPSSVVTRLLMNERIKELMARHRDIQLEVKDNAGWFGGRFPKDVYELYLRSAGTLGETGRVLALFKLMSTVLDELCLMGSADPTNPFSARSAP